MNAGFPLLEVSVGTVRAELHFITASDVGDHHAISSHNATGCMYFHNTL